MGRDHDQDHTQNTVTVRVDHGAVIDQEIVKEKEIEREKEKENEKGIEIKKENVIEREEEDGGILDHGVIVIHGVEVILKEAGRDPDRDRVCHQEGVQRHGPRVHRECIHREVVGIEIVYDLQVQGEVIWMKHIGKYGVLIDLERIRKKR